MSSVISVVEKKDFLKWFLNAFQLKRRECAWLLNYLISDDVLMERVHFVEKAEYCPKALVISTTEVENVPFSFHKHKHVTMDAEKAFHDIRLNCDENIYIQLNFLGSKSNPQYAAVLEENPFIPEDHELATVDGVIAEIFLDKALASFTREQVMCKINEALDNKDYELFIELTELLKKL
ncbi:ReoY family proteolytic degradation factor [Bacillus alkalicellulosilyticus]|uniref:ReoY family proteolytic degradation factor n=1 Tax=Alkalihalobacterium alkalicellulosilyticum TaxID=1912214 RepID=UPI0009983DA5|nr:ReoY family proteolytic degradation factor [Bacillus alkalicellulosilyticus]